MTSENNERLQPLPSGDYNANGKVKIIRPRIMKKLMRYEFKGYFSSLVPTVIIMFILATSIVVVSNICRVTNCTNVGIFTFLIVTAVMLFLIAFGVVLSPLASCAIGIKVVFFGKAGYLTLSTPVSVEEHLFTRYLCALICMFISIVVCILLALYLYFLCNLNNALAFEGIKFKPITFNGFLLGVENFINFIIGVIEIMVALGAMVCFLQKISPKARVFLVIGAIVGLSVVLEVVVLLLMYTPIFEFLATPVGRHVGNLIEAAIGVAVIVGCSYYQLKRLKYNINLE